MNTAAQAAPLPDAASKGVPQAPLHAKYFEDIIPEAPRICGLQLKPLSIGRYRLMARFKVAFVSETETTATAGDLLMGVLICSMECEAFKRFAADKRFKKTLQKWGRRYGFFPPRYFDVPIIGSWLKKRIGDAIDQADAAYLSKQVEAFQKYIKDGSATPDYYDESEAGRVSGAHWSQSIESVLRGEQGWTRQEIDEEPLNKAMWDYFKHMENQGMVSLMTAQEKADLEAQPEFTQADAETLAKAMAGMGVARG